MILVGNKTDLVSERIVTREVGQALANKWNCSFLETSAKIRANVVEVRGKLSLHSNGQRLVQVFYDLIRQISRKPPPPRNPAGKTRYVDQPEPHLVFEEEIAPSQSKTLIEEKPSKCCVLL